MVGRGAFSFWVSFLTFPEFPTYDCIWEKGGGGVVCQFPVAQVLILAAVATGSLRSCLAGDASGNAPSLDHRHQKTTLPIHAR